MLREAGRLDQGDLFLGYGCSRPNSSIIKKTGSQWSPDADNEEVGIVELDGLSACVMSAANLDVDKFACLLFSSGDQVGDSAVEIVFGVDGEKSTRIVPSDGVRRLRRRRVGRSLRSP